MSQFPFTSFFRNLTDPASFALTLELIPGRGKRAQEDIQALELARRAVADGRLTAMSITENAGTYLSPAPELLGEKIRELGLEVIIHLSCKDKNRNQMQSRLFTLDRLGLRNLLVISGDYPKSGYQGLAKPVFDLDSVSALDLINNLHRKGDPGDQAPPQAHNGPQAHGEVRKNLSAAASPLAQPGREQGARWATAFVKGVVVSPFKHSEAELMTQYYKLQRKLATGADFIITQIGYDARKFHEVLLYLKRQGWGQVPVLGNVFIPNLRLAEFIYHGKLPGCVLTEELYATIRKEAGSPDKGKRARLLRGASLLAVLEGLGYAGAHIGGPDLVYDDIAFMLDTAATLKANWSDLVPQLSYWPDDAYFLFPKDHQSGLNLPEDSPRPQAASKQWHYRLAHQAHKQGFVAGGLFYRPLRFCCLALAGSGWARVLAHFEHLLKFLIFGCQHCGDCTLAKLAYLCPQSACPKYLLNGPCGGSRNDWCEVYPGRKLCLYVRVYQRLKGAGKSEELGQGLVLPRNWELNQTSSWINYFQGKDHQGRSQGRNAEQTKAGEKKSLPDGR